MENSGRKKVLIAGGSGLIGTHLQAFLTSKGYHTRILTRRNLSVTKTEFFLWDPSSGYIDKAAVQWADFIVNLAGESIAGMRWSTSGKKKIITSRVQAAELLVKELNHAGPQTRTYIAASAIGFYGDDNKKEFTEESHEGNDFSAHTCFEWEAANAQNMNAMVRTVILRIGIVLSLKGGALSEVIRPLRFGTGVVFGKGDQIYSWIHIDDLCGMILYLMEHQQLNGVYNAVAPDPVSCVKFIQEIVRQKGRGYLILHVPAWVLHIFLGERSTVVLHGQRVSPAKIMKAGFRFRFSALTQALKDLFK